MSSNIQIEKTCQWCGKKFIARTTVTAYCSHRCSGLAYKERKRQKKVALCKEEQQRVQIGPVEVKERDYLTPRQAADLLGVCYKTLYNYINNGTIKAWKLSRKTLVKRDDVDALFSNESHVSIEKEERKITEFYTTKEVLEKYNISNGWFWKVCKEEKFPKTVHLGKTLWSKEHVDRFFSKRNSHDEGITEWYTTAEIQEKFGMTLPAIYCLVSKEGIPKKKERNQAFYSKLHFDKAKGLDVDLTSVHYTYKEAMEKFNMTRDQLHHYIKTHNISRTKQGKYTYISRKELDDLLAPPSI